MDLLLLLRMFKVTRISSLGLASPAPAPEGQECRRRSEPQAGQGHEPRRARPEQTRSGGHRSLSRRELRGLLPGKGACRWVRACTGKDRVSFHTGGAPALRPGAELELQLCAQAR